MRRVPALSRGTSPARRPSPALTESHAASRTRPVAQPRQGDGAPDGLSVTTPCPKASVLGNGGDRSRPRILVDSPITHIRRRLTACETTPHPLDRSSTPNRKPCSESCGSVAPPGWWLEMTGCCDQPGDCAGYCPLHAHPRDTQSTHSDIAPRLGRWRRPSPPAAPSPRRCPLRGEASDRSAGRETHGRLESMTRHSPTCNSLLISKTETSRMHQNIHPAGTVRDAQLQIVVWRECGQALVGLGRVPRQPHTPFAVFLQGAHGHQAWSSQPPHSARQHLGSACQSENPKHMHRRVGASLRAPCRSRLQ